MRWLPHATACVHGTYVVCYSKGIQWCWRPYQLRGEMKQLVVQWTGTLDEFHHNYDDFYHFNSYGGCVGLRWSSDSAGQTTHILQTIRAKKRNGQYIRVSETWTEQLDQRLWILQVLLSPDLLPIPPKYHFKRDGNTTAMKKQQIHHAEDLRKVSKPIFCPLDTVFITGTLLLCADSGLRQCYPVICAWTAANFDIIHWHSNKHPHCPMCEALTSSFGEGHPVSWQLREYRVYFQNMINVTLGDETEGPKVRQ